MTEKQEQPIEHRPHDVQLVILRNEVAELRESIKDLEDRLGPVIEIWSSLEGLVNVLRWVGTAIKWTAGLAITIGGAMAIWHSKGT